MFGTGEILFTESAVQIVYQTPFEVLLSRQASAQNLKLAHWQDNNAYQYSVSSCLFH